MNIHRRRTVFLAAVLWAWAPQGSRAADAPAAPPAVKLVYGFELAEQNPVSEKTGKPRYMMGKAFESAPGPGWRFKDHAELHIDGDYDGPVTLFRADSSRDYPVSTLYPEHATQGKYSFRYSMSKTEWEMTASYAQHKFKGLTAQPASGSYHDVEDWYYQRYVPVLDDALEHRNSAPRDWTGYEVFRFDAFCDQAEGVLAMRVLDRGPGPRAAGAPQGLRTGLGIFDIPKAQQVTCEFPLAEMARAAELDLANIQGFNLRINGYRGNTAFYIDNMRVVKKAGMADDLKLPLVKMRNSVEPFARKVLYDKPPARDPEKLKKQEGAAENVGPVVVYTGSGAYACGPGHFGGGGATYYQNARRGMVAYDDQRLVVVFKGVPPKGARRLGNVSEGGGMLAMASFDGGKTWGGMQEGEKLPTHLASWYWRANCSSDAQGNLYLVGTQNCCSYNERYDVFMRRLSFTGTEWLEDRFAIVDQNLQKCPGWSRALKLRNGRTWVAWTEGWGGVLGRYSDDDGYTFAPCKDAANTERPRPFYTPDLKELQKPEAERAKPPAEILIFPAEPVLKAKTGGLLLPYRDGVAVFSTGGDEWRIHDGEKWSASLKGPAWKNAKLGVISEAAAGKDLFLARSGGGALEAARFDGTEWHHEVLETENAQQSILTASGEDVYCFYVLKKEQKFEIRLRRFKDGAWQPGELLTEEAERINHLAAPQTCPPDYVCLFWDQYITDTKPTWVKFMKVAKK